MDCSRAIVITGAARIGANWPEGSGLTHLNVGYGSNLQWYHSTERLPYLDYTRHMTCG